MRLDEGGATWQGGGGGQMSQTFMTYGVGWTTGYTIRSTYNLFQVKEK